MSIRSNERNQEKPKITDTCNQRRTQPTANAQYRFHLAMQKRASPPSVAAKVDKNIKLPFSKPIIEHHAARLTEDRPDKPESSSAHDEGVEPMTGTPEPHQTVQKIDEHDANIIAHTTVGSGRADDINLLIKKLTINFHATEHESRFTITSGVFAGSQFSLLADKKDLRLRVSNASSSARRLLTQHQSQLKISLAAHEINLRELAFLS